RKERPDVPPELALVLDKMMAKKPNDRYQQPVEVSRALQPFVQAAPTASQATRVVPSSPKKAPVEEAKTRAPWYRRRNLVAAAALSLVAGVGFACWKLWGRGGSGDRRPPYTNTIDMEFVWIPAGQFSMGSPPEEYGRRDDEGPVHDVSISRPFYLAAKETTVR